DEIVAEDQPYAEDASPIAQSPKYVPEYDFETHPEDDDDEDPEEDPVDYLADGGDDDDDKEESSEDDEDDDMDVEADEEEEEEHPAPADSVVVAPTATDQAPSAKETDPFETNESAATSIPAPVPIPAWTDSEVVRLLAISSPPASPLSPWSSPPPQIPFPPLPPILSPPSPILSPAPPPSPIRSLGYRAVMIRLRDVAASTSSPPLQLPFASRREDRPEVTLPPRKRLDIALGPGYEVGESSSAATARTAGGFRADYGFVATIDREIMRNPEREVGYGITDSWDEIVKTLQGAPTERQLLAGRLNMLFRDRRAHAYTRHLMETEARMSREAWVRATDASDLVHGEVMSLRTTVLESDFEAHPEDDDDEDPEEDPVDYPADGGNDGDDEEESSDDDEDDEDNDMDVEADEEEEEEEEHPAPADSVVVAPTAADQASSAEETEPFETDESAATPPPHLPYCTTSRISIPAPVPMPSWTDSEIVRLLAISSPPASPLSPWEDRPEVTLPTRKRLDIALGPRYEVGESSSATAARPAGVETLQGAPVSTDTELGRYVREFETRVRQDTDEIYMRLDDEQTERQLLAGRLNMLFRDRRAHAYTHHLMETKARMSREAWVRATDASDLVHGEVMSLRTTVLGQMSEIRELQAADRRRQTELALLYGRMFSEESDKIEKYIRARDALRSTNGDDRHNSGTGVRRTERATHECTYTDFLKCQPLPFKGTEGVASLSQWCERMESVFHISNCAAENQVKFATCTLHSVALTWWNTHVQTVGHEAAYEADKIEKYVGGLPDMNHGSVVASKPKTMQEAIEITTELMVKKIRTFAERETASKRKFENTSRNTQN
nr:hypothetical protein [Tanacetum cinerariifolium]